MSAKNGKGAVVVTGASSGIGKATAKHLDGLGFQVFATVRRKSDAQALEAVSSDRVKTILMDLTDEAGAGLAGLVNNAGVGFSGPLEFVPLDEVRWLFEVNVFGLLAVSQAFLPMLRQAQGRIVNVSSTASLLNAPFHGPYTASKLSVNGLSNSLRLELRPFDVSVSVIICGSIKTPIWEKGGAYTERVTKRFPSQAWALYGDAFGRIGAYFTALGKRGKAPETAARVIAEALTAKRPRQTYLVGPDARLSNIIHRLFSGRMRDWAIVRLTGVYENNSR
jgi:NAD(P)-dependent dehydrogenase (short-subunit alcohol dehydrogenase family)